MSDAAADVPLDYHRRQVRAEILRVSVTVLLGLITLLVGVAGYFINDKLTDIKTTQSDQAHDIAQVPVLRERIDSLIEQSNERARAYDARLDKIDGRYDRLDGRVGELEREWPHRVNRALRSITPSPPSP